MKQHQYLIRKKRRKKKRQIYLARVEFVETFSWQIKSLFHIDDVRFVSDDMTIDLVNILNKSTRLFVCFLFSSMITQSKESARAQTYTHTYAQFVLIPNVFFLFAVQKMSFEHIYIQKYVCQMNEHAYFGNSPSNSSSIGHGRDR